MICHLDRTRTLTLSETKGKGKRSGEICGRILPAGEFH
jgi:hypothetical protein